MSPEARLIFFPILSKIVRMLLLAATGYLVHKGWIDSKDSDSIAGWGASMWPVLLTGLPGVFWSLHSWLRKFHAFADLEERLHLPVTGQPSALLVEAVAVAASKGKPTPNVAPIPPPV